MDWFDIIYLSIYMLSTCLAPSVCLSITEKTPNLHVIFHDFYSNMHIHNSKTIHHMIVISSYNVGSALALTIAELQQTLNN